LASLRSPTAFVTGFRQLKFFGFAFGCRLRQLAESAAALRLLLLRKAAKNKQAFQCSERLVCIFTSSTSQLVNISTY